MKEEPILLDERTLIQKTLGDWVVGGVEHVGSTSVPGMTAKPIIDIMVGVKSLQESKACIPLLEEIGYGYADYKKEIMHWFCKPSPMHREFHLYLMEYGAPEWKERIKFRDILRSDSAVAAEYINLKQDLASKFHNDREAYTEAKAEFVKQHSV